MALETYNRKRDFRRTPEPAGKATTRSKKTTGEGRPSFVVHEHHATRLHYDFRLEADGVLWSWAVPREPSLDPSVKRLAVRVEDHPLAYGSFHGEIPQGQYGAGSVSIWDHGTYENLMEDKPRPQSMRQALEAGHLEFALHGKKLKGRFALIRMHGSRGRNSSGKENWLLIKMKDAHARAGSADGNGAARPRPTASRRRSSPQPATNGKSKAQPTQSGQAEKIQFTNVSKIMFPEAGKTKGDVLKFYQRIAPLLLPHLRDRPITLQRLPEGLSPGAPRFWQKNTPSYYPAWIPRIQLPTEAGKPVSYTLVNNAETLLYLVNQGAITFHTYFSTIDHLDRPDFVLFDLDPGEAGFEAAIAAAKQIRDLLQKQHLEAAVKTSGKSGLHVLVPSQHDDYDSARQWALEIAEQAAAALPDLATTERSKAKRRHRLYIDVMQNALGHHAVPPYVLRATPEATVSTPLDWDELKPGLDPKRFTMDTLLRRIGRKKDPMSLLLT